MAENEITKRGPRFKDISGKRFGRLLVIRLSNVNNGKLKWECLCDCGKTSIVAGSNLGNRHTQSCGCLHSERTSESHLKHGRSNSREYHAWRAAVKRCTEPKHPEYFRYGARGIAMCGRWIDSFERFISDMGPCPEGLTLDRKQSNGPYSPDNCRWATPLEQTVNRRVTIFVTHQGETLCLKEWSRKTGIPYSTLMKRRKTGRPLFERRDHGGNVIHG